MGTTADKLQAILNSKAAIKTAINNKGGSLTDSTPLDEYATAIGNIQTPILQSKTASPSTSQQTITPDGGYNGLSQVTINAATLQNVVRDPMTVQQTVTPSGTAYGLGQVIINPVTSSIDANITAGNIKKDVTILGVTGTFEGGGGSQITFYNPPITRLRKFTRGSVQGGAVNTKYTIGTPKAIPVKKAYIFKFDGTLEELSINNNYTGYKYFDTNDNILTEFSYTNVDGQNYISISKLELNQTYWGWDTDKTGVYVFELDENKCEFLNNSTYIGIDMGSNVTSTTVARYYTNVTDASISATTFTGCWSGGYTSYQSSINKYFLIPNFINW